MERYLVKETRACNLDEVRDIRKLLQRVLDQEIPTPSDVQHMLLCFAEMATNIVRHSEPTATRMSVYLCQSREQWKIIIEDNGGSWHPGEIAALDEHDLMATGGRGLSLISHYVDEQSYSPGQPNRTQLMWHRHHRSSLNKTVLVVEDDPSQQRLYQAYLQQDYRVLLAGNGEEALKLLEQQGADLILSDINMPGMNGLALRDKLNAHPSYQLLPFIFITHGQALEQQTSHLGIDDLLPKPISKQQLLASISRVLNRSAQIYATMSDHINEKISSALQPKLPQSAGHWRFAYGRRTAGTGGGDFILTEFHPKGLRLMLVDILGHSIESKFFSYAYAGYLRGFLSQSDCNIKASSLLAQISSHAARDELLSQTLMTCCLCDLREDSITLSCAGHPPALMVGAGKVTSCDVGGPLPGLLPDAEFPEQTVCVPPGHRLVLYTDGLFESGGSKTRRESLEKVVNQCLLDTLTMEIEQAAQVCMQTFDRHAGCPPDDDATLILIEGYQ